MKNSRIHKNELNFILTGSTWWRRECAVTHSPDDIPWHPAHATHSSIETSTRIMVDMICDFAPNDLSINKRMGRRKISLSSIWWKLRAINSILNIFGYSMDEDCVMHALDGNGILSTHHLRFSRIYKSTKKLQVHPSTWHLLWINFCGDENN